MIGALVPSKVWDSEGQLLDALEEGSKVLQNITDMFAPLMKNFRLLLGNKKKPISDQPKITYVSSIAPPVICLLSMCR